MNHNHLEQVHATDILKEVSHYNNSRSITDEVIDLPIDLSILNNEHMRKVIEDQNPFGSKEGLTLEAHASETDGQDFDVEYEDLDDEKQSKQDNKSKQSEFDQYTLNVNNERIKDLELSLIHI